MEFTVDSYRDDEVEASAELATKAFSIYEPIAPIFSPDFFRYLWAMPGIDRDLLLCARMGDRVVGQVFVLPRKTRVGKNVLDVGTVAVVGTDPDFKRMGIARRLMGRAIETSRKKGLHGLILFTNPPWNAYRLYESLGFRTFYSSVMNMKVLDAKVVARALGMGYMAPFLKLKAGVKERPLPGGFTIREYEERDRPGCVAMEREFSKDFEYAEQVSEESWVWWQESMSPNLNPRCHVMEKGGELVGVISSYTAGIRAKNKKGIMRFQLGALGNFCYRRGFEEQVQALLARELKDMKESGIPAASNGQSPTIFRQTELIGGIWKKYGFIKNKDFEEKFMYKSLDPRFDRLESMRSFFLQPY